MATKRTSSQGKGKSKIHKVMKEHKSGTLKSGSGKKVKSRKQAVAIALLLRHSWRHVDLTRIARQLGLTLTTKTLKTPHSNGRGHHVTDSPARLGPVKALRSAPTPTRGADGLDRALGRARGRHLRDGRHRLTPQKGR